MQPKADKTMSNLKLSTKLILNGLLVQEQKEIKIRNYAITITKQATFRFFVDSSYDLHNLRNHSV